MGKHVSTYGILIYNISLYIKILYFDTVFYMKCPMLVFLLECVGHKSFSHPDAPPSIHTYNMIIDIYIYIYIYIIQIGICEVAMMYRQE